MSNCSITGFGLYRDRSADKVGKHGQSLCFLVEKNIDYRDTSQNAKLPGIELARFAQEFAQDLITYGAGSLYFATTLTGRAFFTQHMRQRFAGALAGHFDQPQRSEAVDRQTRLVLNMVSSKLRIPTNPPVLTSMVVIASV